MSWLRLGTEQGHTCQLPTVYEVMDAGAIPGAEWVCGACGSIWRWRHGEWELTPMRIIKR